MLEASPVACVVLGHALAVGEVVDDLDTCTRCTCHAVDAPGCVPLAGCADVGRADTGAADAARFVDGARDGPPGDGPPRPPQDDRDGDGQPDGVEEMYGFDPDDPASRIPRFAALRGPDWTAGIELVFDLALRAADVVFVLDTTESMRPLIDATARELAAIVDALADALPRATYGAASYDDFAFEPLGDPATDRPFTLHHQQTLDVDSVQRAIAAMSVMGGGDVTESGMEALYQALTGAGYDQDCDGEFDEDADVLPFSPNGGDAFGGTAPGSQVPGVPGTGKSGGSGFNGGSLPIVVYGTDTLMRDPARGHQTPGGCPGEADHAAVLEAARRLGARLVAVAVGELNDLRYEQMAALATGTGSLVDLDGDGLEDPLVLAWDGEDERGLREGVVDAVTGLLGALSFARGEVEADDPEGLVASYDPAFIGPVEASEFGTTRSFRASLRASEPAARRVVEVRFALVADGAVTLDEQVWVILVEP